MNALFDLTDKVAVITGASRGIGRSIAENMARCGARVVISSRKQDSCEQVAAAIREEGGQAIAQAANISSREDLEALVARAREEWGRVDILVCNAATNPYYGPLHGLSDELFDKMMHNNVRSNLWLCQMVLPEMAERRDGVVIVVSSIGGVRGNSTQSYGVYGSSTSGNGVFGSSILTHAVWGSSTSGYGVFQSLRPVRKTTGVSFPRPRMSRRS